MPDELQLRKNISLFVLWKDITIPLIINSKNLKQKKHCFNLQLRQLQSKNIRFFPRKNCLKYFQAIILL